MKGDLNIPKVTGVELVAIQRNANKDMWDIILINRNSQPLKNILVSSKGYGSLDGNEQKTSILRHLIETLSPNSFTKIEPIEKSVFHLTNEYWVSYYLQEEIYDKKFIFLPESIQDNYVTKIPGFDFQGVLHT